MNGSETRKWLRPLIAPLSGTFWEVLTTSFFINIFALAAPIFTMQVYDRVVFHSGMSTLQGLVVGMVVLLLFEFILKSVRSKTMQTVALRIDVDVGRRLFRKIMALPMRTLENRPAPAWQQLFRDVDTVRNTLSGSSAMLVVDLPFAFLFLGLVFIIAPPLGWVLLLAMIFFSILAWRAAQSVSSASEEEKKAIQGRDALVGEAIIGRSTVKALALDHAVQPMWEQRTAAAIEESIQRGNRTDRFVNMGAGFSTFITVAMTTVGAIAVMNQELTIGALIAANMLSGKLLGPMNQLVSQWRNFSSFRQSVERLGQIFSSEEDIQRSAISLSRPKGQITLEKVTYAYGDPTYPAVNDVSLTLSPGGMTAILGRNGSGKTTLVKLILGLYRPTNGRVLLDMADISQFTRRELATWVGYVPQETILFNGSIRENIAFGSPHANDEDIIRSATQAGVHTMILDLPEGYGTSVGEAGMRMSGGMRQRIAIARALVGDPAVLLLDEPSGSLDRQAEEDLKNTLNELAATRTIVAVTHSPVFLSACRDVVVLDKGKLAANGPAKDILPRLMGTPVPAPASAPAPAPAPAPVAAPSAAP
ncbi:MAG: type I secretion system ATPase, partial [Alphaproteobacteria bacterium RIFOXYD12_FULL_60_8]